MQEDKKLQSLLTRYSVHEPSEGFEDKVMQLVIASKEMAPKPLMSRALKRVLLSILVIVIATLLVTSLFIRSEVFLSPFSITIPENIYTQLFSFFIVFWIVMIVNLWWNKRNVMIA